MENKEFKELAEDLAATRREKASSVKRVDHYVFWICVSKMIEKYLETVVFPDYRLDEDRMQTLEAVFDIQKSCHQMVMLSRSSRSHFLREAIPVETMRDINGKLPPVATSAAIRRGGGVSFRQG
jgi:hypothetical protein